MKRKYLKVLLPLLLVAVVGVGATTALLMSSTGTVTNTFAAGEVTTHIEEEDSAASGSITTGTTTEDGKYTILPKKIRIQNTNSATDVNDDVTCFIRARITVSPESLLTKVAADGSKQLYLLNYKDADIMTENGNLAANWVLADDGFWYYLQPVEPLQYTDYLMQSVKVANAIGSNFDITIYQESVNYQNFATLFTKAAGADGKNVYTFVGGTCRGDSKTYGNTQAEELAALQKAFSLVTAD